MRETWPKDQLSPPPPVKIEAINYEGWRAERISNQWVKLVVVPQLGGRLMQVSFGSHSYLFVNPKYKGKYFAPGEGDARTGWVNYGGDKIWPLPEGTQDEQHWPGPLSDVLDDGTYSSTVLSRDPVCTVRLEGPSDPNTGLQFSREITLRSASPEISFHSVVRNASSHTVRWALQSVSQYDTADPAAPERFNHDFWAFTPVNPQSAYSNGYSVRSGLADDPSFSVKNGIFSLHCLYLQNEVWLDSEAGWIAIVDAASNYAMVEMFAHVAEASYPGKATVIFYKNGPALQIKNDGMPILDYASPENKAFYMEAELNSPMVRLLPGETYAMDTRWFPTRGGKSITQVTDAGLVETPLTVSDHGTNFILAGTFGVFFPGKLLAHLYDRLGRRINSVSLGPVSPLNQVNLHQTIEAPREAVRVSLHLIDNEGNDRGNLGEAQIMNTER